MVSAAIGFVVPAAAALLMLLDLSGRVNLLRLPGKLFCLLVAPSLVLLGQLPWGEAGSLLLPRTAFLGLAGLAIYLWLALSIAPVRDGQRVGARLKIMAGGRAIVPCALWGLVLQLLLVLLVYPRINAAFPISRGIYIAGIIFALALPALLLLNGVLRMLLTSRRLNLTLRLVLLWTWWIPLVNLPVLRTACRRVYEEYDFACYKRDLRDIRAQSDICKTRYPLVMVHGVFFRDLKYFNYWGRIPRELTRYGATVYYGNQEAVGTIETNGEDIRDKILEVIRETGCEKVNIIAHSKGGLDARYAVSRLGLEEKVASLTTVGTPHQGCRFVDGAINLIPDTWYCALGNVVDASFRKLGDKRPDFANAIRQFTTDSARLFNSQVPDPQGVYCQSYMNRMKGPLSDPMLAFPYCIIRVMEGPNDGLVSTASARWGHFRGVLEAKGRRGVSHADMIDLKREDYRGFDVVEAYVQMVRELREMGY